MHGILNSIDCEPTKQVGSYIQPTSRQLLVEKLAHRKNEIAEVEAAIKFLDENPNFEIGMNLLSKALR